MKTFAGYTPDGTIRNLMICDEVGPTYEDDTGLVPVEVDEQVGMATHYILGGVATEKQLFNFVLNAFDVIANGTDEAIISNIPAGVQVRWPDGQTDIVTGGEIRFSVDLAGTYTFQFTAVPYLDQEVVIEAIPAT